MIISPFTQNCDFNLQHQNNIKHRVLHLKDCSNEFGVVSFHLIFIFTFVDAQAHMPIAHTGSQCGMNVKFEV